MIYLLISHIKFYFRADIGLIGLAVMGQNLILNMNDHDFTVNYFF
jgi:6-phosphogluconate dehydrogenase